MSAHNTTEKKSPLVKEKKKTPPENTLIENPMNSDRSITWMVAVAARYDYAVSIFRFGQKNRTSQNALLGKQMGRYFV